MEKKQNNCFPQKLNKMRPFLYIPLALKHTEIKVDS